MHIIWQDMLVNVCCVFMDNCPGSLDRVIIKLEVLLCFFIQEPEISHLHHTGTLSFDSVIDNANSSGVVDVDGCWRLWMPKFVKS